VNAYNIMTATTLAKNNGNMKLSNPAILRNNETKNIANELAAIA